jgi:hypothetical protein
MGPDAPMVGIVVVVTAEMGIVVVVSPAAAD